MHRLAHRVRPALRALRAVHTGSHESPASAAASGSRIPLWGVAAVFAGGAAVGYMASGEKKSLKVSAEITRELKAPKPHPEPQNASAVEPTSLVASSVDAPSADASVTTDNALTESHPDEKQASVEDEGGDDTALEGEVPKVAAPYDPETGEFNWDCPCLGGLPDTICGEQFKESFRCFVKSEAEPKGMDCIDAFNAMQQCFREHPEVYAREIEIYDEVDKEGGSPGADTETQLQDSITSRVDSAPAQQAGGITPPVEHPREISKPVREKPAPTSTRRTA